MDNTLAMTYTDREIEEWRSDTSESLGRIEKKVDFTNGKVADLIKWKERATGAGWAFGTCVLLIVLPLAGWLLYNQAKEPDRVNRAAKDAVVDYFSQYNVKVITSQ